LIACFARLDRFVGAGPPILDDDASWLVLKVRDEVRLPFLPG